MSFDRVAAIYDIHGNAPALQAVLDEIETLHVDLVIVGGDVLPGPQPLECFSALDTVKPPIRFIRGNGEREVLNLIDGNVSTAVPEQYLEAMRWVAQQLGDNLVQKIKRWPMTTSVPMPAFGNAMFCHATPLSDSDLFTSQTPEQQLVSTFNKAEAALVVCGHTHMQFARTIGNTRVVNAGSVGMPFGPPGAYWLLLERELNLRRTEYSLNAAAEQIRNTSYPGANDYAQRYVLNPPSEAEMRKQFEQAALGGGG